MAPVAWMCVRFRLGVFVLAFLLLYGSNAVARQYANSKHPFWNVGDLNKTLSLACQQRLFSQLRPLRLTIGFYGKVGTATIGIAKMGWNLYDPGRLARPGFTYHFFHDGYSDCRVYMAGKPLANAGRRR